MAHLIIIGNGFDLAHNLPTSYSDFLIWYFNKSFKTAIQKKYYQDENIIIQTEIMAKFNQPKKIFKSLSEIRSFVKDVDPGISEINFKNTFIKNLYLSEPENNRWVDIEMKYYESLANYLSNVQFNLKQALILQDEFSRLIQLFKEYIRTEVYPILTDCEYIFADFLNLFDKDTIVLNFNYTNLPQLYKNKYDLRYDVLSIHGSAQNENDHIVFGFGDEKDNFYHEIENLNDNRLLEFVKSFSYLRDDTYTRLSRFIQDERFNIEIIGHSCGLSDRTLLSYLFEHPNCTGIRINYYQDYAHYRQTTMEISRHFENKQLMRNRVIDFTNCVPCPQIETN